MEVRNPYYIYSNAYLARSSESVTSMSPFYSAIISDGGSVTDQTAINDKTETLVDINT